MSQILQACAEVDKPDALRRAVRALEEAARLHPEAEALLLTMDFVPPHDLRLPSREH